MSPEPATPAESLAIAFAFGFVLGVSVMAVLFAWAVRW